MLSVPPSTVTTTRGRLRTVERGWGEPGRRLLVCRLGCIDYREAWELQKRLATARRLDAVPDTLLLLQHPNTYTLGRRGTMDNVLLSARQLARRRIALYEVDRGGDVTYHGPGQLVGYPILKLPRGRLDYVRYIRDVERSILDAVGDLGIEANLQEGYSGVWVGDEKVCAIGMKVDAYGITSHGFAINVNTDLAYFSHIIPCGIADKGVTSLQRIRGRRLSMERVARVMTCKFAVQFEMSHRGIGERQLHDLLGRVAPQAAE